MAKRPSDPVEEQPDATDGRRDLPLVALRETVIFPEMIVPLQVGREKSVNALNAAVAEGGPIALVTQRQAEQEDIDDPSELYTVGTLAKIAQVVQLQDGTVRAIVQGQSRLRLHGFSQTDPYLRGRRSRSSPTRPPTGSRSRRSCARSRPRSSSTSPTARPVPPEAAVAARNITEPGLLADMVAYSPDMTHRAAPGAARDDRRRRAPQARLQLPRPPGRDPRAQGQDPVRGQVGDGQDPARVHPARAAQGHPARARRGRPAAGRDQRAARQGRGRRHAGGDQGPGDQGDRPDEPDPVGLAGGRRHPHVRRLAGRPAVERVDRGPARHQGGRPHPRRGPLRPGEDQGAHPRVPRGAHARGRDPQPDPRLRRPARRGQDQRSASASPRRWAASSCG